MRLFLAGLLLIILPTLAFAQATGQVQSIGFGQGVYRPNCWTPMLVQLNPTTNDSGNYEIEVWQHDLDGDRPVYTRQIVLNGADQAPQQNFWTYFLPQPTDRGLPDRSKNDLQKDLQVFLCVPGSHKQIAKLPITSSLINVDPPVGGNSQNSRGSKLILAVSTNGTKQATWTSLLPYDPGRVSGFKENVEIVPVHAAELPEDPIGYQAVDAIIWLDGNPNDLSAGNLDTFNALKDYVRSGGKLVICQSTDNWQEDQAFGDLLPVDVQGLAARSNFEPLRSMAQPHEPDPFQTPLDQVWGRTAGPYQMARATTRPSAVVDEWIDWKQDGSYADATPYLTRKQYGLGQVIWVAQPLTIDGAPKSSTGWGYVWNKVLGIRDELYVVPDKQKSDDDLISLRRDRYESGSPVDLGFTLVQGLNLNSRANWLILLAIVFFIIYGLVAGPGSYLYLASKNRKQWSWYAFGISALVAASITYLVVQLVLRGPPEIKHVSFVRIAENQPAFVDTRFGLYIPRDGSQKIALANTATASVSYISPFAEHPQQLGDVSEFPSPTEYFPAVRDLKSDSQPQLTVDYRSSSKKFQARWVGDLSTHFTGSVKLDRSDTRLPLSGYLTNASNVDLTDVYLAFNVGPDKDWMIYVPFWAKGQSFDIKRDFAKPWFVGRENLMSVPGDKHILSDEVASDLLKRSPTANGWANYWFGEYRHAGGDDPNVVKDNLNYIYPMLALFDRIPAMPSSLHRAADNSISVEKDRADFLNRGARMLNASGAIAAGQLVILGTSPGPLPIPLEVDDEKMTGDGMTYYEFILPMDRSGADAPTTRPLDGK